MDGLKIFLREPPQGSTSDQLASQGGAGNCIACHQAPHFTDFLFHNTGIAQEEYDSIHGEREFAKIEIPEYERRQQNYRRYLPTKAQHPPVGSGPFADIPSLDKLWHTDRGLWNVFLNPAFPKPQDRLMRMLRKQYPDITEPSDLLEKTVAAFKTPGLRDLGHSNPYFHTGRFGDLERAIRFYRRFSDLAREGNVRNADDALNRIYLNASDIPNLAAFLRSLNEDYD